MTSARQQVTALRDGPASAPPARGFLVLVALAVCLVTLGGTLGLFGWGPVRWTEVSGAFRQTTALAGPTAGICAVFVARVFHLEVCGTSPGRPARLIVRRHLVALLIAVIAGYTVGMTPLVCLAAARATAGGSNLAVIVSGVAAMAAWTAAGYWLGAVVRFPFSMVAWVLAALLVCWVPLAGAHLASTDTRLVSAASISPIWDFTVPVGWREAWPVALFRVGLAVSIAWTAWAAAPRVARPLNGSRWRNLARLVPAAAVLPLVLVVAMLWRQPAVITQKAEPDLVCEQRGAVSVCVEREVEVLLDPMTQAADEATRRFGHGEFDSQGYQEFIGGYNRRSLPELRAAYSQAAALEIIGFRACLPGMEEATRQGETGIGDSPAMAELLTAEVTRRLTGRGTPPLYHGDPEDAAGIEAALTALSDQELKDWITEHRDGLSTCSVLPEDLLP